MRVILGTAQRAKLKSPQGEAVRPTSDLVKEAIFNCIQFDIEGRRVLDLFAGSGQLGIEALSRGAERAVFVDLKSASLEIVKENLAITRLAEKAKLVRSDYKAFLTANRDTFDIAFLDPPYGAGILLDALERVSDALSGFGRAICEHPAALELPEKIADLAVYRRYRYGKIMVSIYQKEGMAP